MFKIYISNSVYDKIVEKERQNPASADTYLHKLLKQQPIQLLTSEETDCLKTQPENVLKHPSALYILDIDYTEALSIQKRFGVVCISGEHLDISLLIDVNDIHISSEKEKLGRGWDSVLDSVENLPSNALLLNDRYLFASRYSHAGDGIANIRNILNELLPRQFMGGDYHVTVIFDNNHTSYTFNDIATQLNRIKQQLGRDYPIMMEVLGITQNCSIYSKLHNRLIVSNYYHVEASHKLAAFNGDKGTARQTLIPMALFTESSLNGISTPPLKVIYQTIDTIYDFSKSLSRLIDHSVYLYAVNGKRMERCMSIRNRLIKS